MLASAWEWAGAWKKAMTAVLLTGRPHLKWQPASAKQNLSERAEAMGVRPDAGRARESLNYSTDGAKRLSRAKLQRTRVRVRVRFCGCALCKEVF